MSGCEFVAEGSSYWCGSPAEGVWMARLGALAARVPFRWCAAHGEPLRLALVASGLDVVAGR